jgi:SAM-dependent methyltransferase
MHVLAVTSRLVLAVSLLLPTLAYAQATQQKPPAAPATQQKPPDAPPAQQKPYEPTVGQAGKDVVWVPSPEALVEKMLDMAKVTPQDYVIDLGSGDGRTVIAAAKRGARALGIEYNPDMVELSKRNAAAAGVSDKASFVKADIFESDFSKATVITMFLLPSLNLQLRPKLLDLAPGTRLVSNSFTMEAWQDDDTVTLAQDCTSWCTAHFWIVPAKVAGTWKVGQDTLTLSQEFQMVSGTLGSRPITAGRLRGADITFIVGNTEYTGRVNGNTMSGNVKGGNGSTWTATRSQ